MIRKFGGKLFGTYQMRWLARPASAAMPVVFSCSANTRHSCDAAVS
jgi:hypothetical protein